MRNQSYGKNRIEGAIKSYRGSGRLQSALSGKRFLHLGLRTLNVINVDLPAGFDFIQSPDTPLNLR